MVRSGLENALASPPSSLEKGRIGLLCNQASVDRRLDHARFLLHRRFPGRLAALYAPQHGFFGEKQDNMVESGHMVDPRLGIPVFSLYGETRKPDAAMLDPVDTLVVDLQDAGTRVYTFVYTLSLCMEAAAEHGKKVVVLDRPNPLNGVLTEGNLLAPDCASFVGRYPLPMRHGLTVGELALLFNERFGIGCDLQVVPMKGWRRDMHFGDTGLPWVAPSPNLPVPATALVYPGQVLWEGTNVSEGRGTTQPFELFGAPYIDPSALLSAVGGAIPGAILRPAAFEPTSNKWRRRLCRGFQIHVTDPWRYRPYATTLRLLRAVLERHRGSFEWKAPPYEYEYRRLPIDLIVGDRSLRERVEALESVDGIVGSWKDDLAGYDRVIRPYRLYR